MSSPKACVRKIVTMATLGLATVSCSTPIEFRVSFDQEPCNQHTKKLVSGFTVTSGDGNVVGGDCSNTPDFSTPTRSIDLDGGGASVTESDQIFPAGNYELEFALAGHPFRPGTVLVEFGAFSKEYHLKARQPFVKERERAIADKPSSLKFTFSQSGEGGPTLDDVVVVRVD